MIRKLRASIFIASVAFCTNANSDPIALQQQYEAKANEGDLAAAETLAIQAFNEARAMRPAVNTLLLKISYDAALLQATNNHLNNALEASEVANSIATQNPSLMGQTDRFEVALLYGLALNNIANSGSEKRQAANILIAVTNGLRNLPREDPFLYDAYKALARYYSEIDDWDKASNYGNRMVEETNRIFQSTDPIRNRFLINGYLFRGQGALIHGNSTITTSEMSSQFSQQFWYQPLLDIREARRLYGLPVTTMDDSYYTLLAWERAISAVARTRNQDLSDTKKSELDRILYSDERPLEHWLRHMRGATNCPNMQRPELDIRFPEQAQNNSDLGAVVAIYDIDPSGQITNVRIAAAVPKIGFSTEVARGLVRSPPYDVPTNTDPKCLKDHMVPVQFSFGK